MFQLIKRIARLFFSTKSRVMQAFQIISDRIWLFLFNLMAPKSRARLLREMVFQRKTRFHDAIHYYVSSPTEYKRSQQVIPVEVIDWIRSFNPGDVFYDIGANVGMFSLYVAKEFKGSVKVVAFEPSFTTFESLSRNIFVNHEGASILPLQLALGKSTELGMFNYADLEPGGSLHTLDTLVNVMGQAFEPTYEQRVLSFRLDDLVSQFGLPSPNHIKLDVDGAEPDILHGAKRTMSSAKVKSVMVEIVDLHEDDKRTRDIQDFFLRAGFRCQRLIYHGKETEYPRVSDYVFARE